MSRRPRKTTRPGRYPAEFLRRLAQVADSTNIRAAARSMGVSTTLVRRAMQIHGVEPKPIGRPRVYDESFAREVAAHRASARCTLETARFFGVDTTTVKRFANAFANAQAVAA